MGNGPRYKVHTRYGWFSLDEGSYRDYLAGKLWINWPPLNNTNPSNSQTAAPPNTSKEAVRLRDYADKVGLLIALQDFNTLPPIPCKERMHDLAIYELNLSVRSSNGLMRAGVQTYGKLAQLTTSETGISSVRNLGAKSVKEIYNTFLIDCYERLLPYERAEYWQEVLNLNEEAVS